MLRYKGNQCPVCNKDFMEDDDVVVCPICGSPHHRECYKEMGHCGNEEYHLTNRQWEGVAEVASSVEKEPIRCGNCGTPNPHENLFCNACGTKIGNDFGENQQSQASYYTPQDGNKTIKGMNNEFMQFVNSQVKMDQKLDAGVTMQEACDYIGPNSLIFAMKFKAFAMNRTFSFNWSAFFFGFYYCFYRKMYKLGAVALALFLISMAPIAYYAVVAVQEIMTSGTPLTLPPTFVMEGVGYEGMLFASMFSRFISMASMLFLGMFFNKLYYKEVTSKVAGIKKTSRFSQGTPDFALEVARRGGINKYAILIITAGMIALHVAFVMIASMLIVTT